MLNSDVYDSSITAMLEEACQASDLEGLAILDLSQDEPDFVTSYSAGVAGLDTVDVGNRLLAANPGGPAHTDRVRQASDSDLPLAAAPGSGRWIGGLAQPARPAVDRG